MQQMGVNVPAFGVLMNDTLVVDGGAVDFASLIHPKVEPELAFVTSRELSGLDCTIAQVLAATDFVMPAMEVIDSRFRDFKFDLPSVIADNTSAARYVVGGAPRKVDRLDLRLLGVVMERNGQLVGNASGAAILGHPAAAVAALVHHLAAQGKALPAGSLVGTGAPTKTIRDRSRHGQQGRPLHQPHPTPRHRVSALHLAGRPLRESLVGDSRNVRTG
jgi:2-oxo-3-hexenedioate decarboxylase